MWRATLVLLVLLAAAAGPLAWSQAESNEGAAGQGHPGDPGRQEPEGTAGHIHAPVPAGYRSAHVPASVWTDPRMIERGRQVFVERCAMCHGETGDGKGPAAASLPVKPPDLRDSRMVNVMAGNYWFWRVSEGGTTEPFRSLGSAMPPWKDTLSVEDRWAVIAYQHTFSSHQGPHVTSEHPEMAVASGAHGFTPPGPASPGSTSEPGRKHEH